MPSPLTPHQRRAFHDYLTGEKHAYASTLLACLSYLYGTEFLSNPDDNRPWTPSTLRLQVIEDTGIDIDDKVMDKIQAAIIALTDDRVFSDAVIFNNVATALFDVVVDEWDEPEVEELAWAMAEMLLLRGEDGPGAAISQEQPVSDDVEGYIRVVLQREGFTQPPRQLSFVVIDDIKEEDYSDDPNMYASIFKEQERKRKDVDDIVDASLTELMQQLTALPLGDNWLKTDQMFEYTEA